MLIPAHIIAGPERGTKVYIQIYDSVDRSFITQTGKRIKPNLVSMRPHYLVDIIKEDMFVGLFSHYEANQFMNRRVNGLFFSVRQVGFKVKQIM